MKKVLRKWIYGALFCVKTGKIMLIFSGLLLKLFFGGVDGTGDGGGKNAAGVHER